VFIENREAMLRYLEALFYLFYKPRAENLEQHMQHYEIKAVRVQAWLNYQRQFY